jgi:hypothetical protein
MEKQFVTYEIAKQLKRLGFDEECLGIYCPELDIHNVGVNWNTNNINDIKKEWYSAPLWQQVIDWLIEKLLLNDDYFELELRYFSDYSGGIYLKDKEIIDFDNKEMLIESLIQLLNK